MLKTAAAIFRQPMRLFFDHVTCFYDSHAIIVIYAPRTLKPETINFETLYCEVELSQKLDLQDKELIDSSLVTIFYAFH